MSIATIVSINQPYPIIIHESVVAVSVRMSNE